MVEDTFPHLEASIGGEISIDIYPKGQNKAQVLDDLKGLITFFGDRCEPGGNAYPIASKIEEEHIVHNVKDWKETYKLLKTI